MGKFPFLTDVVTMSRLVTRLFTWLNGELVGEDEFGNKYYRERGGKRRWVMYAKEAEPSQVPPEWHRWLHGTTDVAPSEQPVARKPWEKDAEPNPTGTAAAYMPQGHMLRKGTRPESTGDYEPWTPSS